MTPDVRKGETELQEAVLSLAYSSFSKGLNLHAFFKIHDHAIGEDLVQDTFLKTWKYLVKGGEIVLMKAFLYHVLNNLIIDEYRKRKMTSLDALLEKGYEPQSHEVDRLFNFLDGERAVVLIQNLPIAYKAIMDMRYIQDLSLDEISKQTGISKSTLAVKLHRGLAKLKSSYKGK